MRTGIAPWTVIAPVFAGGGKLKIRVKTGHNEILWKFYLSSQPVNAPGRTIPQSSTCPKIPPERGVSRNGCADDLQEEACFQ
jgi:hypothetical protein